MEWFFDLITNPYLLISIGSWFVAQVAKVIIYAIINKEVVLERMVGDGGMPSAHSATVTSIATMAGLLHGFGSFEFAIAAIFAIVVCHDAVGVRREAGKHAELLFEITKVIEELANTDLPDVAMKKFVGHTLIQVAAGMLIGIANAIVVYLIFLQ
jgi:acid phosphatase family membrane protein YuiD